MPVKRFRNLLSNILQVARAASRNRKQYNGFHHKRKVHSAIRAGKISGICYVIDGDTIMIKGVKVRLAGIDAPELNQPWGEGAKRALARMCRNKVVSARIHKKTSYDRVVAHCQLPDGTDLSAAMVGKGHALDWSTFSRGRYRRLEPAGIRRKLVRTARKQSNSGTRS